MFLVSRLDSDDADGDGNYAEDVIALVQRSTQLTVNKYAVTLVFDSKETSDVLERQVARYMRTRNWCVYFDRTDRFLHGAFQPPDVGCGGLEPNLEGVYVAWPELAHITQGKNHRGSEAICHDYARWYKTHPAGFFDSFESYNGVGMRKLEYPGPLPDPPTNSWQQGSVLHWIAAGGSFTFGNVNGPVQSNVLRARYTIPNLYEHRLTWAEAIWSGLEQFTGVQIPVGDPLAVVTVYDPDMIPDGIINQEDLDFVEARLGQPGPEGDINGDGIVDEKDIDLVEEVFGRDANAMPEFPGSPYWPLVPITANRCGDVDNDGVVDSDDLLLILAHLDETCPGLDVDHDGVVSIDDYDAARLNLERCLGDVNNDGVVDNADFLTVFLYIIQNPAVPQCPDQNCKICTSHPAWNQVYDVNCDGCINNVDWIAIQNYIDQGVTCE